MTDTGTTPILSAGLHAMRHNPEIADYFTGNSNRMASFRAMLDLLQIPYPEWAVRTLQGRAARHRAMVADFRRDYPGAR